MSSTNTSAKNPHFNRIERAPYELGYLLRKLPEDFSAHLPTTPDALLIAEAAASHAENANNTIMSGLEALGNVLFVAGANDENEIGEHTLANLGCLLQHLAIEAQFLQETTDNLKYALRKHGRDKP